MREERKFHFSTQKDVIKFIEHSNFNVFETYKSWSFDSKKKGLYLIFFPSFFLPQFWAIIFSFLSRFLFLKLISFILIFINFTRVNKITFSAPFFRASRNDLPQLWFQKWHPDYPYFCEDRFFTVCWIFVLIMTKNLQHLWFQNYLMWSQRESPVKFFVL